MSRLPAPPAKRKRAESDPIQGLTDIDRQVLNLIKGKRDRGIWKADIKIETKLPESLVTKALRTLMNNSLIKEVKNIQNKGRKHYMAAEFEPSKEISGGAWYVEGELDKELIAVLKDLCMRVIRAKKVATSDDVNDALKKSKVITFDLSQQQVLEILNSMVLDNEIIEVKSTGFEDYHSIPVGTVCYRMASAVGLEKGPKISAMASMPCGVCPRISNCTPDGIISPSTCVYYTKWLNINF